MEKLISQRGFVVGGIDGIGITDDDRLPNCVGEGDLALFWDVGLSGGEKGTMEEEEE